MRGLHRIVDTRGAEVWINLELVRSVHEADKAQPRLKAYTVINVSDPVGAYHVPEPAEQVVAAMLASDRDWRG